MKALLVDLDDTLLDYSGGVDECWRAGLRRRRRARRRRPGGARRRHRARPGAGSGTIRSATGASAWTCWAPGRKIAAHGLERLGRRTGPLAAAVAEDFAARRWEVMRLFPGVARGARPASRAAACPWPSSPTATRRQQRRKIERYDLARYFDVILIEGEFGAGKPEEAVYRHVLERLGVRRERGVDGGRQPRVGRAAPQRLGLRGVWVDRAGTGLPEAGDVVPHRIIRAFPELVGD